MTAVDRERIERAVREILLAIGEDPERPGLARTPARVAEAYAEFFGGLELDPVAALGEAVHVGDNSAGDQSTSGAVILRDIDFRSICEHHLLPFVGVAHIAYVPGEKVVGLGRLGAVVEVLAARPQLQERLAEEIADALEAGLGAKGVLVVLDAVHRCVAARGSRQSNASTVTVVSRGSLGDSLARAEIMGLIGASRV